MIKGDIHMAEKKDVTMFTGEIFYGLTSQGLAFQDRVDVEIEGDKFACYENKRTMLGKSKGTNLLRLPLRRVNGVILAKPAEVIELSKKEAHGDEMCGENVAEAAKWLEANVSGLGKVAVISYKGAKNMPFNVILHIDMMGYNTVKKFIQSFEIAKAVSLAAQKKKLDEKKE